MPRFYQKFGRLRIAGDFVGSEMCGSNSRSSSVIMAFWLDRENNLSNIDYSKMRVGVIQYFVQHELLYESTTSTEIAKEEHVFAYVRWKELHPRCFCYCMFHARSSCCFLPVQRIACRCAHAVMPVTISNVTETLFIACPIPFKYSL